MLFRLGCVTTLPKGGKRGTLSSLWLQGRKGLARVRGNCIVNGRQPLFGNLREAGGGELELKARQMP